MPNRTLSLTVITFVIAGAMLVSGRASAADSPIEFNRDIRPILADHCFACHGPDSASRKGDLRLDKRDAAIAKKAIKQGDLSKSEFISRIDSTDPDAVMPPG